MRSAQLFRNGNVIRVFKPFWDPSRSQKFGRVSVNQSNEDVSDDPYEGNFSFTECDQYTKVSVIGAAGRVGRTLSLLLKTCPLIDHLCLFDTDKAVNGLGIDISHIDTKCNVSYVCGMRNIQHALNAPDVVIIAAGCPAAPNINSKKLFQKNAPIIAGISEACARFCPKACIILITSPINSLLPVVGSVYQVITNKIPSRKLFGLTSLDVVRANTFVAEVVRKDPSRVIVPVIGGTSQDTIVPVLSQMKPCCKIKQGETVALTECLKRAEENLMDCQNCGTRSASSLSTAYAGFRFTSSLVMALKGAENVIECAFVKSDVIPELEYLASPLKLGVRGIEYNFGYPPLSEYELVAFQKSAPVLIADIELGKMFVSNIQETVRKGLVWRRLTEEAVKEEEPREEARGKGAVKQRQKRREEKMEAAAVARREEEETVPHKEEDKAVSRREEKEEQFSPIAEEAVRTLLRRFFRTGNDLRGKCNEIATASILDPGTCRDDSSLHVEEHLDEFIQEKTEEKEAKELATIGMTPHRPRGFLRTTHTAGQSTRSYHKLTKSNPRFENARSFGGNTQKKLVPVYTKNTSAQLLALRSGRNKFKSMNAKAKQKYRSFHAQKKFTPSASVLLLLDERKRQRAMRNLTVVAAHEAQRKRGEAEKKPENKEGEGEKAEEKEEEVVDSEAKQLVVRKEKDKYRDFILKQIRELKRENEELKKRLTKISEDNRLQLVLQTQTDKLELEKTKLKACWLIMSSTMDAFSNFCRRFTSKEQLLNAARRLQDQEEAEDEFDDTADKVEEEVIENKSTEAKNLKYDERYFRFLQKLMEDQMESQMEGKRRTQVRK